MADSSSHLVPLVHNHCIIRLRQKLMPGFALPKLLCVYNAVTEIVPGLCLPQGLSTEQTRCWTPSHTLTRTECDFPVILLLLAPGGWLDTHAHRQDRKQASLFSCMPVSRDRQQDAASHPGVLPSRSLALFLPTAEGVPVFTELILAL